jgi:hypothetical protein
MTTWASFRDDTLRALLKDTVATYRWTDTELLQYANWGITDICRRMPQTKSWTLTGTGPAHTLPEDFAALNWLSYSDGSTQFFIEELTPHTGDTWDFATPDTGSNPWGWVLDYPEEGYLYITRLAGSGSYTASYEALRAVITDSSTLPFSRHRWLEWALACYVGYCAHLREGVGRASLEQWAQRPDLPVGNPLNVEAREWLQAYQRILAENTIR